MMATYMKNLDLKLDDEDQALIVLCSLSSLYENFVNFMFYGKEFITLEDVKASLSFAEMRTKLNARSSRDTANGLVVKERLNHHDRHNNNKGHSKPRLSQDNSKVEYYYYHKFRHYKNEYLVLKTKGKKSMENSNSASPMNNNETVIVDNVLNVLSSDCCVNDGWI